jgi:hypothetical protein
MWGVMLIMKMVMMLFVCRCILKFRSMF